MPRPPGLEAGRDNDKRQKETERRMTKRTQYKSAEDWVGVQTVGSKTRGLRLSLHHFHCVGT